MQKTNYCVWEAIPKKHLHSKMDKYTNAYKTLNYHVQQSDNVISLPKLGNISGHVIKHISNICYATKSVRKVTCLS